MNTWYFFLIDGRFLSKSAPVLTNPAVSGKSIDEHGIGKTTLFTKNYAARSNSGSSGSEVFGYEMLFFVSCSLYLLPLKNLM